MTDGPKLGQLIAEDEPQRDAVHIAVAPVIANELLRPGDHVGFVKGDTRNVGPAGSSNIGIIDPFLKGPILPGQECWLLLYPQTITSLRHDWTHPVFASLDDAKRSREVASRLLGSTVFLETLAESVNLSVSELLEAADNWVENGEHVTGGAEMEGVIVPQEFWRHYETVTGRHVAPEDRGSFFSCSC